MTDAKPVEVGELIARLNHVRRIVGNMCSELRPPKMSIPARPDCDEDFIISATVKDSQDALLALQADVARLTQENARLAGEVDNWRKKYGNDKPWDSPSSRTPIPTAIITKARRDEQ